MKQFLHVLSAAAIAATLSACGGGSDSTPVVAVPTNTVLAAAPTTTAAVAKVPFTFPAGVSDFGTTAPTTIAFTDTSPTPAFAIESEGKSAKGTTTFGSCIFKITESTFPAGHRLALGQTITVHPCSIVVDTKGITPDAPAESKSIAMVLGQAASTGTPATVDVTPGGQLTLNGNSVGTVTLTPVTGT